MMKQGLLWFDKDPTRSLSDKIAQAVERYAQKFGHQPNTCCVNPQTIVEQGTGQVLAQVRLVAVQNVLPHHFWIGVTPLE